MKKLPVPFLALLFAMTTGVAAAQDMGIVTGRAIQPAKRGAPEKPRSVNPVLDAIKKMFSD